MINRLKQINGTLFIITIIIIAFLKSLFGFYVSSSNIYSLGILDNILLLISAILLITLIYFRAKRFIEWKIYIFVIL